MKALRKALVIFLCIIFSSSLFVLIYLASKTHSMGCFVDLCFGFLLLNMCVVISAGMISLLLSFIIEETNRYY